MKNYKALFVGSLIASMVLLSPIASFAKSDNDNGLKLGLYKKVNIEKNYKHDSVLSKFSNWLSHRRAEAKTEIKTNVSGIPNILGIKAPTVLKIGEVGTWTVKANDPQNGALEYTVDWGDNTANPALRKSESLSAQTSTFTHTYDSKGKYKITFTVTDDTGLKTTSTTTVNVTGTATTKTSPEILKLSGDKNIKVGETETVTVSAYDPQNGTLEYTADWGDTTSVLSKSLSAVEQIFVQTGTFSHVYSTAGTYTATFTVKDDEGKTDSESIRIVVSSNTNDNTKPIISNVRTSTGSTTTTISWNTDEPSTSYLYYSTSTPLDVNGSNTLSVSNKSLTTKHSLNITGLASNTIYHFIIKSVDASDNTATSSEFGLITN